MSENKGLLTRQIAYYILLDVLEKKHPLDQILARREDFNSLPETRDRNFIRMLVSTALRRKGQIDALIKKAQDKPQDLKPTKIYMLLYVGITQLLWMEVADHAAVDVTVRLAEAENMMKQKGLVNALLRRIGREGKTWLEKLDDVQSNMAPWLLEQWVKDYGLVEAEKISKYSLTEAKTDITLKDRSPDWAEKLEGKVLATGSLRLNKSGGITNLEGFDDGAWWVQDASAAIPARLFGEIKNKTVIDLCAAPGGKTAQLASQGANVIAVDRSSKRMVRLKENMARLGFEDNVEVAIGDGAVWLPPEPVDAVLLDAPCSATGTLRRHPDVMHLKSMTDVTSLEKLQLRLLDHATQMIKVGGMVIYCTCSLQKAEGEAQIGSFLARHDNFKRQPITADEVGGLSELITPNGDLRILPYHMEDKGGMDGFYVARLMKT
jgi:16S rRNA (cytosine967-C5)-methyltransferase